MVKNSYIIVSGEPRSGTSMMMQTLQHLGVPAWGEKFFEKQRDRPKATEMNPHGFYETPFVSTGLDLNFTSEFAEVAKGMTSPIWTEKANKQLQEGSDNSGHALKIVTSGIFRTNKDHIDKIILCLRHPKDISYSQTELRVNEQILKRLGEDEKNFKLNFTPRRYNRCMGALLVYLNNNPELVPKILTVQYEDMHFKTHQQIERIVEFLDIKPTSFQVQQAIANVDPSLRRKSDAPELPGKEWKLAKKIYHAISELDISDNTLRDIRFFTEQFQKDNYKWIDEGTWTFIDKEEYGKLEKDENYKKSLAILKAEREKAGLLCTACPYYNRDGSTYVAINSEKTGTIKRKKVKCDMLKVELTLEQCQEHWESENISHAYNNICHKKQ